VLRVLREIGVPDEIFDQKYIEVWNKIDLLEDQEGFVENLKQELTMTSPNYPVVMMSCKNGTNKELFLNEI
jgi:50S ribosomal subunit-associated GTPase HflX